MVISLDPVLLEVGGFGVRWYGLLALVGLIAGVALTLRGVRHTGVQSEQVLGALAWALPVGILTARLAYVLGWWDYYLTQPGEIEQLSLDGLSLWGGLVGGGLVAAARLRHNALVRRQIFDAAALGLAVGIALAQLGAFIDGHGQGTISDVPWATQYTHPLSATPDFGVPRHPVQLYDLLVALALLAVIRTLHGRPGLAAAVFLGGFAIARLALGPLRLDPPFLFGLQIEQLLAAGVLVVSLPFGLKPVARTMSRTPNVHPRDRVAA